MNENMYMDHQHKLTLSPIEKYILYNKFPYKLMLHATLIIFTTIQVLCVISQVTAQNRAQHFILKSILLDVQEDTDVLRFHSLQDFQNQMQFMIENLQNIDDILLQNLNLDLVKYQMNIYYNEFNQTNIEQTTYDIDIQDPVFPFQLDDIYSIKYFIKDVAMIEFIGKNIYNNVQFRDLKKDLTCISWEFNLQYSFIQIGVIEVILRTQNFNCAQGYNSFGGQDYLFVHLIVLLLASISVYLTVVHIYELGAEYLHNMKVYNEIAQIMESNEQQKQKISPSPSESPSLQAESFQQIWKQGKQKHYFSSLNFWIIVSGIGGFFQICGALIGILEALLETDLSIFEVQTSMMGLGCFFAWIMILRYLEYFQDISLMTGTLKESSRNIVMFLLGILPFFFGFAFLAQSIFWKYDNFSTFQDSALSLFSLANGDIVLDTFDTNWPVGLFGQIFIAVFMVIFFTAVQSVFVAIIMEGFEKIAEKRKEQSQQEQKISQDMLEGMENEKDEDIFKKKQLESEQDDEKELVIAKLNLSNKRIIRMIEDLGSVTDEIEKSHVKYEEKLYLINCLRENVDNISRNVKFQISQMES